MVPPVDMITDKNPQKGAKKCLHADQNISSWRYSAKLNF